MNQWKIVWLPVWMNLMLLLEVVLSLVRVNVTLRRVFGVKSTSREETYKIDYHYLYSYAYSKKTKQVTKDFLSFICSYMLYLKKYQFFKQITGGLFEINYLNARNVC